MTGAGNAGSASGGLRRRDPPHDAADVVGYQQRALFVDRDANRAALDLVVAVQEAGEELLRRQLRPAVGEGEEHDAVAVQRLAVPRAVLADEGAAAVLRREGTRSVECQAERRGMRAEAIVGRDRLGDQVGPL